MLCFLFCSAQMAVILQNTIDSCMRRNDSLFTCIRRNDKLGRPPRPMGTPPWKGWENAGDSLR